MRRYKLYVLDLDGTLYRGEEVLPNARESVAELRAGGAAIRYLTNNSGRTRDHYADKLRRLGFDAEPAEVYSSAFAAARVCAERGFKMVFVVGEEGLESELAAQGVSLARDEVDAVVAGICRTFTYQWMNEAMQHILRGARFLATNRDATYPLENGRLEPGAGAIISAIQTCSGVEPEVIGKPEPLLIRMILADTGIGVRDTLIVGDRIDTDIEAGKRAGCDVHLVLSGVTRESQKGISHSEDLSALLA